VYIPFSKRFSQIDGADVGTLVGEDVTLIAGEFVTKFGGFEGIGVGFLEGLFDGMSEGSSVVGAYVGISRGVVGGTEGPFVGEREGAQVSPSYPAEEISLKHSILISISIPESGIGLLSQYSVNRRRDSATGDGDLVGETVGLRVGDDVVCSV